MSKNTSFTVYSIQILDVISLVSRRRTLEKSCRSSLVLTLQTDSDGDAEGQQDNGVKHQKPAASGSHPRCGEIVVPVFYHIVAIYLVLSSTFCFKKSTCFSPAHRSRRIPKQYSRSLHRRRAFTTNSNLYEKKTTCFGPTLRSRWKFIN